MSRKREYKNVMQKVVGRQNSTVGSGGSRASTQEARQRQRQMLQEIRQNISEVRYETNEAIEQMGKDMGQMSQRVSRASTADDDDGTTSSSSSVIPDYGATDTLRMMKQLILNQKAKEENAAKTKAECAEPTRRGSGSCDADVTKNSSTPRNNVCSSTSSVHDKITEER